MRLKGSGGFSPGENFKILYAFSLIFLYFLQLNGKINKQSMYQDLAESTPQSILKNWSIFEKNIVDL